jgi:hypothetical protein
MQSHSSSLAYTGITTIAHIASILPVLAGKSNFYPIATLVLLYVYFAYTYAYAHIIYHESAHACDRHVSQSSYCYAATAANPTASSALKTECRMLSAHEWPQRGQISTRLSNLPDCCRFLVADKLMNY